MTKSIFHYALSSLLVGGIALSVTSCADDDINPNQGNDGDALVRFSINDVQEQAVNRGLEMTRGAIANGITTADLAGHKLAAHSNRNIDVCLIETTVEGVNPIKADAATRAKIKTNIDDDFSSTGIRGAASILTTPEWFHAEKTKSNGELYNPIRWSMAEPNARFFAVYPSKEKYSSMTINNTTTAGSPNVDFTVKSNVADQVDLMTACTGDVHYATQGEHPTTNLNFRHALTAIRFAVGQNLSWNKTIDKVEIRNAVMASKYTLSQRLDGVGADWDHTTDTRGTATLSGVSVSTSRNPNATIMGNAGDNYTFYMIPQVLTSNNVSIYVHCTDGTEITAPLKGEWKAGTTRTYKLSQTNSTWIYTLTTTNPANAANYNVTTSNPYTITSFREDNVTHYKQAVPWKVIGYDANGDGNFSMAEKPDWVTGLNKAEGNGGTSAEYGNANLRTDIGDILAKRNKDLKEATPLGSASAPYNLANSTGADPIQNTANCYIISAPGHYRIPLVYGNAIENGTTNSRAYTSSQPAIIVQGWDVIFHSFKDHNNNDITNPWIEKSNSANTGINGARIIWADESNIVRLTGNPIIRDANNNAFLQFEVTAADIKSGNAVVAATKNGTVVWSWHLWFAPKSAMNPIEVTTLDGIKYNFSTENVGWKPTVTIGTFYDKPRSVKVRVAQSLSHNGIDEISDITITQNSGIESCSGYSTLYQWGNRTPFPTAELKQGVINLYDGNRTISCGEAIRTPETFYAWGVDEYYRRRNVWAVETSDNFGDYTLPGSGYTNPYRPLNTIKSVYDPSPAGYKVPPAYAFTWHGDVGDVRYRNFADGTIAYPRYQQVGGHLFWTNSNKNRTIYFPRTSEMGLYAQKLKVIKPTEGFYLAAFNCISFEFSNDELKRWLNYSNSDATALRPITEN